jgi:uncharacterized repeat protein (TIGR03803 family)
VDGFGGLGSVFRVDADGTLTKVHSFSGGEDGRDPDSLIQASDGSFYGTSRGGAFGGGTIFKISADGTFTTLHSFNGTYGGGAGSLIQGSDGNFYGMTFGGGAFDAGAVFRMLADGTVRTLHSFNVQDGSPDQTEYGWLLDTRGRLLEVDGSLYGTTPFGGPSGGGVIFRLTIPPPGSDLVATVVSDPPTFIAPGGAFTVTETVLNQGTNDTAISKTRFYFSLDAVKDAADVALTGNRYVPQLNPGDSSTGSTVVKVPTTIPLGVYTLFACADAALDVSEVDESNNCLAADAPVTVAKPDLHQTAVSNPPATATPGSKFKVTDTVHNPSPVIAAKTTTRYYLSLDGTKGPGDIVLTGKRSIPELAPDAASAGSATVTIPAATPDGSYRVLACADDTTKLKEADETNNCLASATTVLVGSPDLVTTAVGNPPIGAVRGGEFKMTDTVLNEGTVPADDSKTQYYLSLDAMKSAGDVLLTGKRTVPALAVGASSSGSKTVTVPLAAPFGNYYVLACADDLGKVGESDNGNNCRASITAVTISP